MMNAKMAGRLILVFLAGLVLIASTGCQSFGMSGEDYDKLQHGQDVNPKVGEAVGTVGTIGYYGAWLGALIAQVTR